MSRIPLINDRSQLRRSSAAVFDEIVATRGEVLRPFELLLHVPGVARHTARLGARLRWSSGLSDHNRELAIVTTAFAHGCDFELEVHLPLARSAGVSPETITSLRTGADVPDGDEAQIVTFVQELCATSTITEPVFKAVHDRLGDAGTVELTALIGYYTMLAFTINTAQTRG